MGAETLPRIFDLFTQAERSLIDERTVKSELALKVAVDEKWMPLTALRT